MVERDVDVVGRQIAGQRQQVLHATEEQPQWSRQINQVEWNTEDRTFDFNVLFNYRVNAGTVLYLGYDDHYQQGDLITGDLNGDGSFDDQIYLSDTLRRTNRAIFMKFQYLFRV